MPTTSPDATVRRDATRTATHHVAQSPCGTPSLLDYDDGQRTITSPTGAGSRVVTFERLTELIPGAKDYL